VTAYAVDTPPSRDTGSATVVLEGGDFGERQGTLPESPVRDTRRRE
jgi:hypothetical protein